MALFEDIEIPSNNLYSSGRVIEFTADGEAILIRDKLVYESDAGDAFHVVKEGETLDRLAEDFYGKIVPDASKWWWVLADVNNIFMPLDDAALIGTELLIPNILKVKLIVSKI